MSITPTAEQQNVVEMSKIHDQMKIAAYAGAAKTSTLVLVAEANPVKSIMLTFNKALADEARERFPSWVECRTTHSLAYQHFGAPMREKLSRPRGAYKNVAGTGSEIGKYFKTGDFIYLLKGERETRRMKQGGVGVAIKETVARFEQSADENISEKHVSKSPCDTLLLRDENAMRSYSYLVLTNAQKLWDLRCNLRSDVLATHDTYLKLYQLSKPNLGQYEIMYLDESQDVNPVVMDIFLNQMGRCKLIAVGDSYQNIYSWRGSVNGMMKLDWPEAKLSKSFRFGQAIGDLADCVLAKDGVIQTDVKGWEQLETQIMQKDYLDDEVWNGKYTMLFRTNGALIFEAVSLLEQGRTINLEIDIGDFTKLLESAIALFKGEMAKVKHESLIQFESWKELGDEAQVVKGELLRVYNMVKSGAVYNILQTLLTHENHPSNDIILTTAHKSKGREWPVVILGDDFPSPFDDQGDWIGLNDAERNLLYVALTRVKKLLGYNQVVQDMINRVKANKRFDIESEIRREIRDVREIVGV